MRFGYTTTQWDQAKVEAQAAMSHAASKRRTITYTQLTHKIAAIQFDPHDTALHWLLGEVTTDEDAQGRGMLSVVVTHKHGDMEPGGGFFQKAEELGRTVNDQTTFWVEELKRVWKHWSTP